MQTQIVVALGHKPKAKPLCGIKVVNGKYTFVKYDKGDNFQIPLRVGDSIELKLKDLG